jgi:hypothetical protein
VRVLVPAELHEEEERVRGEVSRSGQPAELHTVRVAKGGKCIPALVRLAPVFDKYGRTRGISHWSFRLLRAGQEEFNESVRARTAAVNVSNHAA